MTDLKMRSQLLANGKLIDLNCGRYCATAVVEWWAAEHGLTLKPSTLIEILPPAQRRWGLKIAWSPSEEGRRICKPLDKPVSFTAWQDLLTSYGPIIAGGRIGLGDWGPLGGFGHAILFVGAMNDSLYYKDPLRGNRGPYSYAFRRVIGRIESPVHALDLDSLRELVARSGTSLG